MSIIRQLFARKQRLTKKSEFASMYASGAKCTVGPLLIHRKENSLGYSRLGLSIPKRVGNAAARNRMKRMCREAFRLSQHDITIGIDVVITVRPHDSKELSEYIEFISEGLQS